MHRVCQVFHCVFALIAAATAAADGTAPERATSRPETPEIEITAWEPKHFADLTLANPALAATWARAPRWWGAASTPRSLPEAASFGRALRQTLAGVLSLDGRTLEVVVAAVDSKLPEATAHGASILILVPETTPTSEADLVRAVALAVLDDRLEPAPPDPRCNEQVLALGESLAVAGAFALAGLPPELRPVHDWLEEKDVRAALDNVATAAFDGEVPWQTRRAQLGRLARPGGAPPAIAQAAAFLVEAFGEAELARQRPFDLLVAWREGRRPEWPPAPRELRRALDRPLLAGEPEDNERTRGDEGEIARDTLRRAFAADTVTLDDAADAPAPLRLEKAARERAAGGNPCAWLAGLRLPNAVRTGCRDEGDEGGFVYAHPVAGGGGEVVARSPSGEEALLLTWPSWVLFPTVVPGADELLFIDAAGLWRVLLAGGSPPRRILDGDLRFVAVSSDGAVVATCRWSDGRVVLLDGGEAKETDGNGRGGMAWIETDILITSDGASLTLLSLEGQSRRFPAELACSRSLTSVPGGVLASVGTPCDPALVRLALADTSLARLLGTPEAALGMVRLEGGSVALGVAGELWVWSGAAAAQRVGAGLTPGPG